MMSFRRRLLVVLLQLSDMAILFISLAGACTLVELSSDYDALARPVVPLTSATLWFLGVAALGWHLLFRAFRLYASRRLDHPLTEWKDILRVTTLGTGALLIVGQLSYRAVWLAHFLSVFWILVTALSFAFRVCLRYGLGWVRRWGRNLRLVAIVGTNERAYRLAECLERKSELGYHVIGYLDTHIHQPRPSVSLLGTLDDFVAVLRERVIDEVVIALPIKSFYEQIQTLVKQAEEQGVVVHHLSSLFQTRLRQTRVEVVADQAMVTLVSGPPNDWRFMIKRILDVTVAVILGACLGLLLLVTAVAIKLSSGGPILFVQERVGFNKRLFKLYKFRTMVSQAETLQAQLESHNEMDGPVFKIRNDPRITRLGHWLRKTSIDELPQLWNVLKGDMSLVGPRPLPVRDYHGFDQDWQRRRFSVLPGITCLWQISGRNNISFDNWMRLDMEYIDNWTLSSDLIILLRTVPAVLSRRGAT